MMRGALSIVVMVSACSLPRGAISSESAVDLGMGVDAFVAHIDAGAAIDASGGDVTITATDAYVVPIDAYTAPIDAATDDAAGGCLATYGSGINFQLCSFTATSCTFYVQLGPGTACSDYCMTNGGHTCSAEIAANATDHCMSTGGAQMCGHNMQTAICTCPY